MDPYVKIEVGSQCFKTKTHENAGKQPSWFDVFEFHRTNEEVITFTLYDDDIGKDDLIGTATLYLKNICIPGAKPFDDSIKVIYKDKDAGELYVHITFYPDK